MAEQNDSPILFDLVLPTTDVEAEVALIGPRDLEEKSREALDHAMNTIHDMSAKLASALSGIPKPQEVELSFGLKLTAEGKAIVAKATAEVNLGVKLTWKGP